MQHRGLMIVTALALAVGSGPSPAAGGVAGGIAAVRVASGLDQPIYLTSPPADPRLFVIEQGGTVRIIEDGTVLPMPFLDISSLVLAGGELGLLGLAFAPDYATSGHFYVDYTSNTHPEAPGARTTIIERYQVSSDPDVADPTSATTILTIGQPFANHNGGTLAFGPDGMLWIGMGDGGDGGDPDENAQNGMVLLGKMLRIDVSGSTAMDPYDIPDDNPFDDDPNVLDEIWALGLRNPYRWSFDRETGDVYIADVGQGALEEIDVEPADDPGGRNYGWDCKEGTQDFEFTLECQGKVLTPPVHEYEHFDNDDCTAVTGGNVYRGDAIPGLQGHYFFADYCQGKIWSFVWDGSGGITDFRDRTGQLTPPGGVRIDLPAGFGEDSAGELYIADRTGEIFKIVPARLRYFSGDD